MTAIDVLIAQDLEAGCASKKIVVTLASAENVYGAVCAADLRRIFNDPSISRYLPLRDALIKAGCKPMIHADREEV